MEFGKIYDKQIEFQNTILDTYNFGVGEILPQDSIDGFSYHIQQLMSEIGEILSADKRWKNIRNGKYDKENKREEIADCFIVLMNIAMFSGFTGKEIEDAIISKIEKNKRRKK